MDGDGGVGAASWRAAEKIFIGYLAVVALLLLVAGQPEVRFWGIAIQASLALLIMAIAACRGLGVGEGLYPWYAIVVLLISFRLLGWFVPAVHPIGRDAALSSIDRAVFGIDWERPPVIPIPIFTDILQIAYATYYAMPLAVLGAARGPARKSRVAAILLTGFLISYLLYFAVPGRGPHIHHGLELPRGIGIAEAIRSAILWLEGTMWDAFPSGHTLIALLCVILGFRERTWLGVVLAPCALLLVLSTVLLRYHYVIDVAAGLVLVPCSLGLGTLAWRHLEPPGIGAVPNPDV